jgi:hypothetical protein
MNTDHDFEEQEKIIHWLNENLSCAYDLKERNIQLAHSCFDLAIEHHAAICLLYKSGLYGSMFSLLRVEFETFVNGLWLFHVADDDQVKKYENNDLSLGFGTKINMIENRLGISEGALKVIEGNSWSIFSEFTHGGYQSLVRRTNETHTGAVNYKKKDLISALRHAGIFALFSGVQLATMTNNDDLLNEALDLYKSYGK